MLDLAVSLDGFIDGPQGETDWCIMDGDMDFEGFLSGIDTAFFVIETNRFSSGVVQLVYKPEKS